MTLPVISVDGVVPPALMKDMFRRTFPTLLAPRSRAYTERAEFTFLISPAPGSAALKEPQDDGCLHWTQIETVYAIAAIPATTKSSGHSIQNLLTRS